MRMQFDELRRKLSLNESKPPTEPDSILTCDCLGSENRKGTKKTPNICSHLIKIKSFIAIKKTWRLMLALVQSEGTFLLSMSACFQTEDYLPFLPYLTSNQFLMELFSQWILTDMIVRPSLVEGDSWSSWLFSDPRTCCMSRTASLWVPPVRRETHVFFFQVCFWIPFSQQRTAPSQPAAAGVGVIFHAAVATLSLCCHCTGRLQLMSPNRLVFSPLPPAFLLEETLWEIKLWFVTRNKVLPAL